MNNFKKIKKLMLFGFIIFACFFMSGCFDVEYHIDIKTDGAEFITIKIGMPAYYAASYGNEFVKSLEKEYKVTEETVGDRYYVIGTIKRSANSWFIPYPNFIKGDALFTPRYLNLLIVKIYSFNAQFKLDKNKVDELFSKASSSYYDSKNLRIPFKYIISVPGKISKCNSDDINGNQLVWKYTIKPEENVDIQLTSYEINYFALIILILIIGSCAVFLWLRRIKLEVQPSTVVQELICSKCGAKLNLDAKFCDNCGEKILQNIKIDEGGD